MATGFPTVDVTLPTKGLPDAKVGVVYSYFLDAIDFVAPIASWALIGGALPASLSLDVVMLHVRARPSLKLASTFLSLR